MMHHYTSMPKSKKKVRYAVSPSSKHLILLLLKYGAVGSALLCLLVTFHGQSFSALLFGRNSDYMAKEFDSNFGTGDYPRLQPDFTDREKETELETDELLNSPDELLLSLKEEELAEMENELMKNAVEDYPEKPGEARVESLGNILFSDGENYLEAEEISVGEILQPIRYKKMWSLQKLHDELFTKIPHKRHVPHVAEPITKLKFHEAFRQTSTAAVFPFDTLRNHGFLTKAFTLEELMERFPYKPPANGKLPLAYNTKSGQKEGLDLGPALYALSQNVELAKGKGFKRNFPRNLKIKSKYLSMLEISHPPFVPKHRFQPPTLWFGTSTADTRLHSDCCDNFVQMITGTKRWFIAPPSDSRHLQPVVCEGKHQSLCWAGVKFPSGPRSREMTAAEKKKLGMSNGMVIDLHAGEMLYLPAGWWHHIENLGPTIMVNFWTYGCENVAVALDIDPTRQDRKDFFKCPAVAQADALFYNNE